MAKSLFAKDYLVGGLCLFVSVSGGEPSFAQTAPRTEGSPAAASQGCEGVLCALTPGSMDRPILAEEAIRIEAQRMKAARDDTPALAMPSDESATSRGAARRKHYVAIAHPRPDSAIARRSVATRGRPITPRPPAAGPINTIFVLAPRPFDPYGGDYEPWVSRLAWPNRPDRAGDRTVFSTDGYREADVAPMPEPPSPEADAAEDMSRRLHALSQQGFQALKADLGGG